MWEIIRKIWAQRKYIPLVKTIINVLADGKISKDEAKRLCNVAIDTFMKET